MLSFLTATLDGGERSASHTPLYSDGKELSRKLSESLIQSRCFREERILLPLQGCLSDVGNEMLSVKNTYRDCRMHLSLYVYWLLVCPKFACLNASTTEWILNSFGVKVMTASVEDMTIIRNVGSCLPQDTA